MTRAFVAAAAALCLAAGAAGQTPAVPAVPPDVSLRFQATDVDRSGGLTVDEAVKGGYSAERFSSVDGDGDGIVTLYEVGSYLAERTTAWRNADTDRDGTVSRDEAASSPALRDSFSSVDRDADGVVRQQEHEAWAQTTLYQNVDLPVVVPNIIHKTF